MNRFSLDQIDVLNLAARFGILDQACIRKRHAPEKSRLAMTKFCSRLVERGVLERMKTNDRVFYRLGPKAKRFVKAPERYYGEPGPQAFEQLRAVLYYCCLGPRVLDRFTRKDFLDFYPEFPESEFTQPYYYDSGPRTEKSGYLGLLRLIQCQKRSAEVVTDLKMEIAKKHQLGEPFIQLLSAGRLLLVLMVYSPEQRAALRRKIQSTDWRLIPGSPAIPIRVHVIPDVPQRGKKGSHRA